MAEPQTIKVRGEGGTIQTLDVPPSGTAARERLDEFITRGWLTVVEGDYTPDGEPDVVEEPSADPVKPADPVNPNAPTAFDPGSHSVDEVSSHLKNADTDERERVLAAEMAGKARKGIVEGPHAQPAA